MTDNDIRIEKEKGLYFRCDEKFCPGHRCKRWELNIIAIQEGEDLSEGIDKLTGKIEDKEINTEIANLSLHLLVGLSSPKTIKVKGEIRGREVVVLIDGEATHNFISKEVDQGTKNSSENLGCLWRCFGNRECSSSNRNM